ncbi:hypothetical protein [Apibacter sp. HY039]|uniref:hypothetical protein n=1 Tax=Apibacter sp. HY039 TaxID=2501476 RepID=UPI000FEBB311|nr:hypothetical protein [Apibacter sp. HY039]
MSIDVAAKFIGNKETIKNMLTEYIFHEDTRYDEITLSFLNKWIWIYLYEETNETNLDINFSKDFSKEERILFIDILLNSGFQIEDNQNI